MLVYRVENGNGRGPYTSFDPILDDMRTHHGRIYPPDVEDPHPGPWADGIEMDVDDQCALASPEGAQAWFRGYGQVLHEAGFELTVWEAQDVQCGRKQVAFRKDTARKVASYPIMEYIR